MEEQIHHEEQNQEHLPKSKLKKNKVMFSWGIGISVLVIIFAFLGIGMYRIYNVPNAQDIVSFSVAKVFRLPVAKVNGQSILYTTYVEDLKALEKMIGYDKAAGAATENYTTQELSDQVLLRLAGNILLEDAAKKYNVTVQETDKQDLKVQLVSQFPSESAALTEINKRYGWDYKMYEEKIMIPYILQNKTSKKLAEDVLSQIKNGANFEEMATKYSEDGSSASGGDLGWFTKEKMVPEFSDAAFNLKKGEITQNLVQTEYGFHIIKLDDRRTTKVKDENGKMINQEEIKARHVLFLFPGMQRYIDEGLQKTDIKLYTKVHNPFLLTN